MKTELYLSPAQVACFANDNDAFIPELWSQTGLAILEENMVVANLVHRDFENEVRDFGDVVNTRRPGTFKIRRKKDGTTLTQQDANATNVRVPLDQCFYTSFTIKDGEASKSFQDLVDIYLRPGMQTIARAVDRAVLGRAHAFLANKVGRLTPVLSNYPDLLRPDHQCPVSFSREPLRYYTGQVIKEGHRLILDADSCPRAAGRLVGQPTMKKADGGWKISFAVDRPDDVEVRIVAGHGTVIRRLGCGVLGPNAPEPFRKDSLQQEVFWDGMDADGGQAPAGCRAEVRVGLTAKFERFIGYDPASVIPQIIALEADPQGRLYVASSAENRSDPTRASGTRATGSGRRRRRSSRASSSGLGITGI